MSKFTHLKLLLFFLLILPVFCIAAPKQFENVYPKVCKEGLHKQPKGQFAVYAFCDDALGTNIAVTNLQQGGSQFEKWPLSKRFWQGQSWSLDVSSIGWVPNKNFLVLATSGIYGEGAIFLLDLEHQKSRILLNAQDCSAEILAINQATVTVGLNDCENEKTYKKIILKLHI